jgi:pimeloyl-ACP methyl ester carboxylesterase
MILGWIFALWLMGCSAVQTHHAWISQAVESKGFDEATITLGEHRVHHWVGGHGPPVVLLHGFGGNGLITWWSQARALSKSHRVIIPDLLWFGGSDSDAHPSLDAQAEAIQALVAHLVPDEQNVDVVGISYGGFVALRYGSMAPERQRRMVLMDSPGPLFTDEDEAAMLKHYRVDTVDELFVPTSPERVRALIELAYHQPPPLPQFVLRELKENVFSAHQNEQRILLAELKQNRNRYQTEAPAQYESSLVIWGKYDAVFPVRMGEALAKMMGAEFFVVDNAGHAPHLEHPARINRKLESFLKP